MAIRIYTESPSLKKTSEAISLRKFFYTSLLTGFSKTQPVSA
jgi:hypothetical protein